jgi:hypothetical protein
MPSIEASITLLLLNFDFRPRQYKHRLSRLKNVKKNEWIWIGREFQRRAASGKSSQAYLCGQQLDEDRVDRALALYKHAIQTADAGAAGMGGGCDFDLRRSCLLRIEILKATPTHPREESQ